MCYILLDFYFSSCLLPFCSRNTPKLLISSISGNWHIWCITIGLLCAVVQWWCSMPTGSWKIVIKQKDQTWGRERQIVKIVKQCMTSTIIAYYWNSFFWVSISFLHWCVWGKWCLWSSYLFKRTMNERWNSLGI